jgi:hypothetical protein
LQDLNPALQEIKKITDKGIKIFRNSGLAVIFYK